MTEEVTVWFQLTLLLVIGTLSHFLVTRFRQPLVVGEIVIGIILGPSVLGAILGFQLIDPELISIIAQLGAIVLLFLIGLESDLRRIYTTRNFVIAMGGVVVPWVVGYLLTAWLLPDMSTAQAIFIGATLVATSVSITAAVLMEMGLINDQVGCAILGAAVVDDILGMMVLAIAGGFAEGSVEVGSILYLIVAAVVFIVVGILVGTKVLAKVVCLAEKEGRERGIEHTGFILAFALALFYAYISEIIGISAIVGAFIAGTIFAGTPLKKEFERGTKYVAAITVPVFFISLGIYFDVSGLSELFLFACVLTVMALLTKIVGCGVPARLMGMSKRDSLAVGIGMAPRLEVALIIALYGLQQGIIGEDLYSAVVFMGVATALVTPFLFKRAIGKDRVPQDAECGRMGAGEGGCAPNR